MAHLSNDSPIPLYYQLKEELKKAIDQGELKPGDKISSERDLEEKYAVSRMTARRALVELENEGYVIREQGRGTFVNNSKYSQHLFHLTGFTEESEDQNLKPGAHVLEQKMVNNEAISAKMGIPSEPLVLIRRVRTINNEPVALEESYIRASLCPGLENVNLNNTSLYLYLGNQYSIRLGTALQSIEARLATTEILQVLKLEAGTPVLYMERLTYLEGGKIPIEYVEAIYRGDKYKLMVEMKR